MKPKLKCVVPQHVVLERLGIFKDGKFQETTGLETLTRMGHMYAWPTVGRPFRIIVGLTRAYETRRVIRKRWEQEDAHMVFETPDARYEVSINDSP